jgi:hypothetical protein
MSQLIIETRLDFITYLKPFGIQYYWAFGLVRCLVFQTEYISETASISILRWKGGEVPIQMGPSERTNQNHCTQNQKT